MKKIMLWALFPFLLVSCSSSNEDNYIPTEKKQVSFSLEYVFDINSGDEMTRSNSDIYSDFYNDKIITKQLIPDNYAITFHCIDNGMDYKFSGKWSQNDMITLLEGNYTVNGSTWADGKYIQEMASLKFVQNVEITKDTENVVLKADYDCFLLFFNKSNITSLKINNPSLSDGISVFTYKNTYYCFVNQPFSSYNSSLKFEGERSNGASFSINVMNAKFEKSKYYFFNDINGSFEIPQMQPGN